MKFLEWNNCIANHFFNGDHAGKDILLFITKQEIINLVKDNFHEETDEYIWNDLIMKLKNGLPGSNQYPDMFDKAIHAYREWKRPNLKFIEGVQLKYPPYLSYLVFSVLPIIEIQGDYNTNNYYDRLNDFLMENKITQNLKGKLKDIDPLWNDLSQWANFTCNGTLGNFKMKEFKTWKFVGKPVSQCILNPKVIRNLPDFFYTSGLTPKTFYQDEVFRQHLLRNGFSILGIKPSILEIIKKPKDEIAQSIIETIRTEFNEWSGEESEIILKDGTEKKIRKNTVVPIKLQFKINEEEEINFSFRIKYSTEPPSELKLDEYEDIYENREWSRTLRRQYSESFELKDVNNKWIAKFEFRNIRLFIRGSYFLLGNDFWVETEKILRTEEMYILCRNEIKESIKSWGKNCCSQFFECSTYSNIPTNYSLFRIKNPQISHDEFQLLKVYKDKKISLRIGTGLKIGYRTYLNEPLPEVEISNADGTEVVYLQYEGSDERFILEKHPSLGCIWFLPKNLYLNSNFFLQIENDFIAGYRQTYKIDEPLLGELSNDFLPKRNKFNSITQENDNFIQGNKIQITGFKTNLIDEMSFIPKVNAIIHQTQFRFSDSLLLQWFVAMKECDIPKFNEVFETILYYTLDGEQHEVQRKMKFSIHILDYLGYVDYDYVNGKIFALPPKLISIPSNQGRKVLLTGLRNEKMINNMIDYCLNSNGQISLSIKKQNEQNKKMLIPDSIIFQSNNNKEFVRLADQFQIEYDEWFILKLKHFLPTLFQYEQHLKNKGTSESYERYGLETKVFNKETLKFELVETVDRNYSLVEFRPGYIPEYGLWINQSYFLADKNWGKYLFINHFSEKERGYGQGALFSKPCEIFFNASVIAVPASLPFPKLISKLFMQLSGEVPQFKQLNLKGKNVWYNVYRNIPSLFTENFCRFILNMNIETTTQII